MKNKIYFILFLIVVFISGLSISYAAEPTKYADTYIVEYGSTVEFTGTYSSITSSNSNIANIEGNKMKIIGTGAFNITVNDTSTIKFFSWNAYLKKGEFWTYNSKDKNYKLSIFTSKTYLAVDEVNSSTFLIEDYLFTKGGSYNANLKGKYITNYYNKEKDKSKSPFYDYSMVLTNKVFQLDLSDFTKPEPEPTPPSDEPSNPPADTPSDKPSDEPSNPPADTPSDKPSDEPSNPPADTPSDKPSDEPSNPPADTPSDEPSDEEPTPSDPGMDPGDLSQGYTVTKNTIVKSDVLNGLPKLSSSAILNILNDWARKKIWC